MSWITEDAINLLMFLAPGLVAVGVFRSLSSYPPRQPSMVFDQIAQALIVTIIVQVICWQIIENFEIYANEGTISWKTPYPPYITLPLAAVLAIPIAAAYENDIFHRLLRHLGVTRKSSFHSGWYSAFHKHPDCYVILHLFRNRYVYGRPEEWPSQPGKGHFRLSEYSWLKRDEVNETDTLIYPMQDRHAQFPSRASILIPASEVGIVEFMGGLPADENKRI